MGGIKMGMLNKLKQMLTLESKQTMKQGTTCLSGPSCSSEASPYGKRLRLTDDEKRKLISLLTLREYDLFLLLVEGFTLKESAKQLSIKYSTANTHMNGIYRKLGVNSRAELIINYRYIIE